MKAAIVEATGKAPIYGDFEEPVAGDHEVLIDVTVAPLSQVTRARASGTHYSSPTAFPFVAGVDGVGRRHIDGKRIYFLLPRAPFGSMAERAVVREALCVPLPDAIDDVTAAAISIPAMSSWTSLKARARLAQGEVVLINGATGFSGGLAVQIARHLGARKIVVTGRNSKVLDALGTSGADAAISLMQDGDALEDTLRRHFRNGGIDIILDYLWGPSVERILAAATKEKVQRPVRFVQIGSASAATITLSYAALRSVPLEMMGCGIGSISVELMLNSINQVLRATVAHGFKIQTSTVPLAAIENYWAIDTAATRTVFVTELH
jgi:NADPH:quinone reductase-like Zn-dependent oxidoreductase